MQSDQRPQLIWDLPLRLWHWALVVCLVGSWVTAEAGFDWTTTHFYFGYSALALVLFRLAWGCWVRSIRATHPFLRHQNRS